MSPVQSNPISTSVPTPTRQRDAGRYFYSCAALILFVLMLLGFQQFYLHGKAYPNRPLAPPIRGLLITHGLLMSAWMVLFVVQPLLVASGNKRLHIKLGAFGGALAACITILGAYVGIQSAKFTPPEVKIWGLGARNFLAVPLISIVLFAVFVAIGIVTRKKPQVHRPMMFMAVMATMAAAVSRIDFLDTLYHNTVWENVFGPFFMTLVIGLILLVIKWVLTRAIDWYFTIGYAVLMAVSWLTWAVAPTSGWESIANALTK